MQPLSDYEKALAKIFLFVPLLILCLPLSVQRSIQQFGSYLFVVLYSAFHDLLLPSLRAAVCAAASSAAAGDYPEAPTATATTAAASPTASSAATSATAAAAAAAASTPAGRGGRRPSRCRESVGSDPEAGAQFQLYERAKQPGPLAGGAVAPAEGADF